MRRFVPYDLVLTIRFLFVASCKPCYVLYAIPVRPDCSNLHRRLKIRQMEATLLISAIKKPAPGYTVLIYCLVDMHVRLSLHCRKTQWLILCILVSLHVLDPIDMGILYHQRPFENLFSYAPNKT